MTKDEITLQSPADVRLQKNLFSLLCSGNALITLSVWTLLRSLIHLYFFLQTDLGRESEPLTALALGAVSLGVIDVALKLIVGFCARAEGLGKPKKSGYIALGILLAALTILWLISQLPLIPSYSQSVGLLHLIIFAAVEITVLYAELDLVTSAIRVRRIQKTQAPALEGEGRVR